MERLISERQIKAYQDFNRIRGQRYFFIFSIWQANKAILRPDFFAHPTNLLLFESSHHLPRKRIYTGASVILSLYRFNDKHHRYRNQISQPIPPR